MDADKYNETSRALLAAAREELEGGDLLQASEKLWGAAAQMVKAVGQSRGWRHDSHHGLFEAVNRLADETGDRELRDLFQIAGSLHFNFYEQTYPIEFIEQSAERIHQFIAKLEQL